MTTQDYLRPLKTTQDHSRLLQTTQDYLRQLTTSRPDYLRLLETTLDCSLYFLESIHFCQDLKGLHKLRQDELDTGDLSLV